MTFRPGQSGNPAGRPPGIPDRRTALRSLLEPHAANLVGKAVELALAGDTTAMGLCVSRLIPVAKSVPVSLDIGNGDLSEKGRVVIEAMTLGTITLDEAQTMLGILNSQARLVESTELLQRIEALERKRDNSTTACAS